ncbi:hypothetical protein EYF80_029063 [Liparis tanakae]|uniref:Uncharacterized protein n=1 Tax=Liparis tanakae TaxID=230148 RepID=A0A4Z2H4N0_9TELE|nr:hypothetical protein EYF80_029063 [Liparis tanakae]
MTSYQQGTGEALGYGAEVVPAHAEVGELDEGREGQRIHGALAQQLLQRRGKAGGHGFQKVPVQALGSTLSEESLFFLRLTHSRLGMPLKASAGMLLMLLPAGQKSFSALLLLAVLLFLPPEDTLDLLLSQRGLGLSAVVGNWGVTRKVKAEVGVLGGCRAAANQRAGGGREEIRR